MVEGVNDFVMYCETQVCNRAEGFGMIFVEARETRSGLAHLCEEWPL